MNTKLLVSIVCPFYNEESGVISFHTALIQEMHQLSEYAFDVVCIDDGSEDNTLKLLKAISDQDDRFRVIELSRNFGKEAALSAGLEMSQGDLIIPIDADLQDPISLIGQLIHAWEDTDADAVLARRSDRKTDTLSKRFTAAAFYGLYNQLSHVSIPVDVGDCRLMTRPVVDTINALPEKQRFMKGLFNWIGFKTVTIEYVRERRVAGKSKFSGWKLWNLAIEGITSFSTLPLRIWTYIGTVGALVTLIFALFIVFRTLIHGVDLPGYASLLVSILFFGSLQLIGLGILGEYVGRTYMESKSRPLYLIRKVHKKNPSVQNDEVMRKKALQETFDKGLK